MVLALLGLTGVCAALVPPTPGARAPRPAYLDVEYWSPDPNSAIATAASLDPQLSNPHTYFAGQYDPCWWDEGCDINVEEDMAPGYVALDRPEMLDTDLPLVPCMNTLDGCTLESAAGLSQDETMQSYGFPTVLNSESISTDPCFWDAECTIFGA